MYRIKLNIFDSGQNRIFSLKSMILILLGFIFLTASGALGADWYVSPDGSDSNSGTTWEQAFKTIQWAIDGASDTDTVTVGDGIYTGTGNRDIDFKGKRITVQSANGPEVTIIDCQGNVDDKHRGFYFHSAETTTSVLDGFTIKNGYGPEESLVNPENDPVQWSAGGAIYCDNASPTIINNIIINNTALYGAGIQCWDNASPTVKNNIIKDNIALVSGGGVWFYKSCNARLDSNIITGNQANNSGGGVKIDFFSDVVVVNNIITNNSVTQPTFSRGGGIYSGNSHSIIANNTITQNSSQGEAGGIYNWCGWPTIVNTIVWGNTGGEVAEDCPEHPERVITASYSNINNPDIPANPFPGTGNIYIDPLFVNPAIGGFHLGSASPCINTGDNAGVPAGITTDFEGDPRITATDVDMGADEYTTDVVYCSDSDSDRYFAVVDGCTVPPGQSSGDCDDDKVSINPEALEIPDNTVDENCDGVLGDISPPDISMTTPYRNSNGVAVDTAIVLQVSDGGLGVNADTLEITLQQQVQPDPATPVSGSVTSTGDPADYEVIFTPGQNLSNGADITVSVTVSDLADPAHEGSATFSFTTSDGEIVVSGLDSDGDGISDVIEETLLHTNKNLKTLFVRPLIESETVRRSYSFWTGFKNEVFTDPDPDLGHRDGFAYIKPFKDKGVEISIIGDPDHPYYDAARGVWPMRDLYYDPQTDPNHPPCDIMEIYYERVQEACPANSAGGNTIFNGLEWTWDTKGLTWDSSTYSGDPTPAPGSDDHYKLWDHQDYIKYHYHKPRVYSKPLDKYIGQGAYTSIDANKTPISGLLSTGNEIPCDASCTESSPMNLIDGATGPPFSGHDNSVEFNSIDFINLLEDDATHPLGMIEDVGARGEPFARNAVLGRTLVHEMGHGLMNASNKLDHCGIGGCIMSGFTERNWNLMDFGAGSCDHNTIAELVHNNPH